MDTGHDFAGLLGSFPLIRRERHLPHLPAISLICSLFRDDLTLLQKVMRQASWQDCYVARVILGQ